LKILREISASSLRAPLVIQSDGGKCSPFDPAKFDTTLITDKAKWKLLRDAFLKAIADAGVEPFVSTILTNRAG
jgi:hypothetical protein